MKKIIPIILLLFISLPTWANQVIGMRYYWDNDSINSTELTSDNGSWNEVLENSIASNISTPTTEGPHFLNISTNDINGWSEVRRFPIYIEANTTISVSAFFNRITAMEYFWNDSVGTTINLTSIDGNYNEILEKAIANNISTPNTPGHHSLNIRTQDLNGWSEIRTFPIYIEESLTYDVAIENIEIIKMEYFIGNDPGVGNATEFLQLNFTQSKATAEIAQQFNSSSFIRGINVIGIRTLDRINNWSDTRYYSIYVEADSEPYAPIISGPDSVSFATATNCMYTIDREIEATYDWLVTGGTIIEYDDYHAIINWDTLTNDHQLKVVGINSYGVGDTAVLDVFVEPVPILTIDANGNDLRVTNDSRWKYQWLERAAPIEGSTAFRHWVTINGSYRARVVTQYGDTVYSNELDVYFDPNQKKDVTTIDRDSIVHDSIRDTMTTIAFQGETGKEDTLIITVVIDSLSDSVWTITDSIWNDSVFNSTEPVFKEFILNIDTVSLDTVINEYKPTVTISEHDTTTYGSIRDTFITTSYEGSIGKEDTVIITHVVDSLFDSLWIITDTLWDNIIVSHSDPVLSDLFITVETISLDTVIKEYQPTITISERDSTVHDSLRDTIITTTYEGSIGQEDTIITTLIVDSLFDSIWVITDTLWDSVVVSSSLPEFSKLIITVDTIFLDTVIKKGGITEISIEPDVSSKINKFAFAPNPININSEKIILCTPKNLRGKLKISIFDNMGNLLDSETFSSCEGKNYSWNLKNRSGRKIVPGTYIATISYKDQNGSDKIYKLIIGVED